MGPKKNNNKPRNWLPRDRKAIRKFVKEFVEDSEKKDEFKKLLKTVMEYHPPISGPGEAGKKSLVKFVSEDELRKLGLHPPVIELYRLILNDPEVNMFFNQMFWQQTDGEGILIPNWQTFIVLLHFIMRYTPVYSDNALVGFPINALINWPMATPAGYACFLNDKVNKVFEDILNYWAQFLKTRESCSVLNEGKKGWFCQDALDYMVDEDGRTFEEQYVCNSKLEHWDFTSWDDFFTRKFREGVRPLPSDLADNDIVNACESAPFKVEEDVNYRSIFWIKEQPYSLSHMVNNHKEWSEYFHGGTIYQAFLSATSYHCWHSPIDGVVKYIEQIPGSYYSQTYDIQDDYASPNMSQGYITHVAARAFVVIEAKNKDLGYLGFLSIGMSEVSSNDVTAAIGTELKRGDPLGMFHFGGSTHCLFFRPGVKVDFCLGQEPGLDAHNIQLRKKIASFTVKAR